MRDVTVFNQLRDGELDDESFDQIFPPEARRPSLLHWSPLEYAVRAARMAVTRPEVKVLDVGAGAGKFCLIGAAVTNGLFFGIEQRESLVKTAREVAVRYKIPRVQFEHGNMMDYDWSGFDSIYLYNPFSENLDPSNYIDDKCSFSKELYIAYVKGVQAKLNGLKAGTRVVTLNGFGGDMPPSYQLVQREGSDSLTLELWINY